MLNWVSALTLMGIPWSLDEEALASTNLIREMVATAIRGRLHAKINSPIFKA